MEGSKKPIRASTGQPHSSWWGKPGMKDKGTHLSRCPDSPPTPGNPRTHKYTHSVHDRGAWNTGRSIRCSDVRAGPSERPWLKMG